MMPVPTGKRHRVRRLSVDDYAGLRDGADVIEADGHGEKVLRLRDGNYLKLFRRKRLISSAAWNSYARRFADNAGMLAGLGVPSPRIIGVYRFPVLERDAVHYHPLVGTTLRQLVRSGVPEAEAQALRERFGGFVARLHELGVFFRSIHLGNIIQREDGQLGLIDIADMRIDGQPLSNSKRKRNFIHLLRYREDAAWLLQDDGLAFARGYAAQAASNRSLGMLQDWLRVACGKASHE